MGFYMHCLPPAHLAGYGPKIGKLHAGDMLAAWLAHDFMHMRQIVNLHLEYHIREAQPFSIKYAAP